MKSSKTIVLTFVVFVSFLLICCNNKNDDVVLKFFEENPANIYWNDETTKNIDSFCADVVVYEDNNRRTGGAKIQSKYKLSIKRVNDKQYVRLDFPEFLEDVSAKTILSDGNQTLVIDTSTGDIIQKIVSTEVEQKISNDLGFVLNENTLTRINLSRIKEYASKLSLDMTEKEIKNKLVVSLPSSYFMTNNETRVSTKVIFDKKDNVLESTETVTMMEDGSTLKLCVVPVYEECDNGELLKIGEYSKIDYINDKRIPDVEQIDYIQTLDEITELSDEDYTRLKESGNLKEIEELSLGDPSDLSYTANIITLYENIKVNTLDDSPFKIIMEL